MPITMVTPLPPPALVLSYPDNLVKTVDLITLNMPDMISGQEEHDTRQNVTWSPPSASPARASAWPRAPQYVASPRHLTPS
jgi:hypothetical protein